MTLESTCTSSLHMKSDHLFKKYPAPPPVLPVHIHFELITSRQYLLCIDLRPQRFRNLRPVVWLVEQTAGPVCVGVNPKKDAFVELVSVEFRIVDPVSEGSGGRSQISWFEVRATWRGSVSVGACGRDCLGG